MHCEARAKGSARWSRAVRSSRRVPPPAHPWRLPSPRSTSSTRRGSERSFLTPSVRGSELPVPASPRTARSPAVVGTLDGAPIPAGTRKTSSRLREVLKEGQQRLVLAETSIAPRPEFAWPIPGAPPGEWSPVCQMLFVPGARRSSSRWIAARCSPSGVSQLAFKRRGTQRIALQSFGSGRTGLVGGQPSLPAVPQARVRAAQRQFRMRPPCPEERSQSRQGRKKGRHAG